MKKYVFILLISLFMLVMPVKAQSGCCSHHDGVIGCSKGMQLCGDGTTSPSCKCESSTPSVNTTPTPSQEPSRSTSPTISTSYVSGCTDSSAINYNKSANKNDGSCQYKKTVSAIEAIPFDKTYEEDSSLKFNEEVVTTEGTDGVRTIIYEVILDNNNKEIRRNEITNEITTPKLDKIVKRNSQAVADDNTTTTMANIDNKTKSKVNSNNTPTSFGDVIIGIITLAIIIGVPIFLIKKLFKKLFKKKI